MWNKHQWDQFRNLPRIKDLTPQEQSRQYWIQQANMMLEASDAAASSSSAAGGAGAGGSGSRRATDESTIVWITPDDNFIIPGAENWYFFILSSGFKTEGTLMNLGVPSSWSSDNQYEVDGKGYLLTFNDGGTYRGIFINTRGQMIEAFETSSYNAWSIEGHAVIVDDPDGYEGGRLVYYFDGTRVFKHNFPESTDFSVSQDYDYGTSDGTTPIEVEFNNEYKSYQLMSNRGSVEIAKEMYSQDGDYIYYNVYAHSQSDFVVLLSLNDDTSNYESIKFLTTTGVVMESIDLTLLPNIYNDLYNGNPIFWGQNQALLAFWDDGDEDIDYLIYNWDGNNKRLTQKFEERTNSYDTLSIDWNSYYPTDDSNSFIPGSIILYMYNPGGSIDSLNQSGNYSKLIYMFNEQTSFSTEYLSRAAVNGVNSISGTPSISGTFSGITSSVADFNGQDAIFTVYSKGGSYSVSIVDGGKNYAGGEGITIDGSFLGGTSSNNLTFNVSSLEYAAWNFYNDCSTEVIPVLFSKNSTSNILCKFITPGTVSTVDFGTYSNLYSFDNTFVFGDQVCFTIIYSPNQYFTYYTVYDKDGSQVDQLEIEGVVQNYRYQNGTLFVRDWNGDLANWYYNLSDGFQELSEFYSQRRYDDSSVYPVNDGSMILFRPEYYGGGTSSVTFLKPNSISEKIDLVYSGEDWGYMYSRSYLVYWDIDEVGVRVHMYDLSGNLVKSDTAKGFFNVDNTNFSNKRFFIRVYEGSSTGYYIMTPDRGLVGKKDLGEDNNDWTMNDYNWWYD